MKRHIEYASSAFNDECFSDRVLRVETLSDEDADKSLHPQVRTFHVSSQILSVHSPFFYKLFRNGMRESTQTHVTLKITPSEEAALEEVLKFMYTHELSTDSVPGLVNVLVVADRFEVASCVSYCTKLMQTIPLPSFEFALLYFELPLRLLGLGDLLQPLQDVAAQYCARVIRDLTKSEEEEMAMALPLCALEAVLGSEGLRVISEDDLYEFIWRWARKHYPKPEEGREIVSKRLVRFIYFPYLSETAGEHILESLHLNAGDGPGLYLRQRVYKLHPVKVVRLKSKSKCVPPFHR